MKRRRDAAAGFARAIELARANPAITIVDALARPVAPLPPPVKLAMVEPTPREMSEPERQYEQHLRARLACGEIQSYAYEPEALALVDDCSYTPDFRVTALDGVTEWHEVKGARAFDDAAVKFKWAASLYREARFYWSQRRQRAWTVRRRLPDGWSR